MFYYNTKNQEASRAGKVNVDIVKDVDLKVEVIQSPAQVKSLVMDDREKDFQEAKKICDLTEGKGESFGQLSR